MHIYMRLSAVDVRLKRAPVDEKRNGSWIDVRMKKRIEKYTMDRKRENKMLRYEADNLTASLKYRNIVVRVCYLHKVCYNFFLR